MAEFKVLKGVPLHLGRGEGGGSLPKLFDILLQIDSKLDGINQRLDDLEQE